MADLSGLESIQCHCHRSRNPTVKSGAWEGDEVLVALGPSAFRGHEHDAEAAFTSGEFEPGRFEVPNAILPLKAVGLTDQETWTTEASMGAAALRTITGRRQARHFGADSP